MPVQSTKEESLNFLVEYVPKTKPFPLRALQLEKNYSKVFYEIEIGMK